MMSRYWSYARWILVPAILSIASSTGITEVTAGEGDQPKQSSRGFTAEQIRLFEDQVQPILTARCIKCHGGGSKIRGNFRLDGRAAVLEGRGSRSCRESRSA